MSYPSPFMALNKPFSVPNFSGLVLLGLIVYQTHGLGILWSLLWLATPAVSDFRVQGVNYNSAICYLMNLILFIL